MSPIPIVSPSILSKRKTEVLCGIANGKTRKEIAVELGISSKTVEYHSMALMTALRLYNVALLTQYALVTKLVEPTFSETLIVQPAPVVKAPASSKHPKLKWKGNPAMRKYAAVFGE